MNDYYSDEYYEDYEDYEEPEVRETSFTSRLCKAPNGHLYVEEVTGVRYAGQDWGEAEFFVSLSRINQLHDELQPVAIRIGRDLKPGFCIPCYLWDHLDDDDDLLDDGVYTGDQVKHQLDDDLPEFPF